MEATVSLQGPVEQIDEQLVLRIPIEAGGKELHQCCKQISTIEGGYLKIVIPDWLAAKLGLEEGSLVRVDNGDGKLNLTAVDAPPPYTREN